MKKLVIDCTNKTQEYVKLTKAEIKEIEERQKNSVPELEPETFEESVRRIVKEELSK